MQPAYRQISRITWASLAILTLLDATAQTPKSRLVPSRPAAWEDAVCRAVRKDYRGDPSFEGCSIQEVSAATGDGADTVLVDIGAMGAYTDTIVVYRYDHGTAVAAKFKDLKGRIDPGGTFLSGASVMNSAQVWISAEEQTIYSVDSGTDEDGKIERCEVRAYRWDPAQKLFSERTARKEDRANCER